MTNEARPDATRRLRSFGRTRGRPLSKRQQRLVDDRLPDIAVPLPDGAASSPADLFAGCEVVWLEIGFGGGEHLVAQARQNPQAGLIGCEPFIEGVAKALSAIEAEGLANVRLHPGDVRDLLDVLAPASLDRVFILFPDPWPKKRHHKRRLIQPELLEALHRALGPGAPVRFATDVNSYADEALARFLAHGGFEWTAECAEDWRTAPADHVTTRYEHKRLGDCAPVFFEFIARARPSSLIVT